MQRRLAVLAALLMLVRSQEGTTREPRFESIDDLPAFYRMLSDHIGRMIPPEGQADHYYYSQLFQPYYPYSKAQISAALLGDFAMMTQASPLHYDFLPPGYGYEEQTQVMPVPTNTRSS